MFIITESYKFIGVAYLRSMAMAFSAFSDELLSVIDKNYNRQ